jgi:hypothetical protein
MTKQEYKIGLERQFDNLYAAHNKHDPLVKILRYIVENYEKGVISKYEAPADISSLITLDFARETQPFEKIVLSAASLEPPQLTKNYIEEWGNIINLIKTL